ncbi:hypothetical protein [Neomegalonema perideroedes]|uniref:hypothetical protein n=1 Tax=Neomegalonema perideroedes TaxID=217219 RepID=UPI00036D5963|nr:hypothetical protein [Neomegalonema perideroedes]
MPLPWLIGAAAVALVAAVASSSDDSSSNSQSEAEARAAKERERQQQEAERQRQIRRHQESVEMLRGDMVRAARQKLESAADVMGLSTADPMREVTEETLAEIFSAETSASDYAILAQKILKDFEDCLENQEYDEIPDPLFEQAWDFYLKSGDFERKLGILEEFYGPASPSEADKELAARLDHANKRLKRLQDLQARVEGLEGIQ